MKVKVNPDWLTKCGLEKYIDHEFEVLRMIDYGNVRGDKIYEVVAPWLGDTDGRKYLWAVWSARGVEEINDA